MERPPWPMSSLAMVFFGLSHLLDTGEHDDVTLEDVKHHADDCTLIKFLTDLGGGIFASGFLEAEPQFEAWYVQNIRENCAAMNGRERRKYGIKNRGLCLLISYTAEIMQHGDDLQIVRIPTTIL